MSFALRLDHAVGRWEAFAEWAEANNCCGFACEEHPDGETPNAHCHVVFWCSKSAQAIRLSLTRRLGLRGNADYSLKVRLDDGAERYAAKGSALDVLSAPVWTRGTCAALQLPWGAEAVAHYHRAYWEFARAVGTARKAPKAKATTLSQIALERIRELGLSTRAEIVSCIVTMQLDRGAAINVVYLRQVAIYCLCKQNPRYIQVVKDDVMRCMPDADGMW